MPPAKPWSLKALHRLMILSATYQQSSRPSPRALAVDPENRLLARMPRRRLEAEALRDALLAVSGRLDTRRGGPAVRDFASPRRTLYQMTIRSDRSSFGPLFDAADSTASVDRRESSTVAPQALFMLNDPFVAAQARALADATAPASDADVAARLRQVYLRLYARAPTAAETRVALAALERLRAASIDSVRLTQAGAATPPAAAKAPSTGTQPSDPAWTVYCHLLLCANEFLYVD